MKFDIIDAVKDTGEILEDKTLNVLKNGRYKEVCTFTLRKKQAWAIAKAFDVLGMTKKGGYIRDCGGLLGFSECPHGHYKKLTFANFCGQRLCPMCQWRRSLKTFGQVSTIYKIIMERYNERTYRPIMLTLTIPNCGYGELKNTVGNLTKSFNRLFDCKKKNLPFSVVGYFRAVEVTYSKKRDDFHPHIHALILVTKRDYEKYFSLRNKTLQKTQDKISMRWAELLKVEKAFSHVQRLKNSDLAMVAEVAKYSTKPSDYIGINKEGEYFVSAKVLNEIHEGLFRKRLVSFGGLFKELKKELELADVESKHADLVNVDDNTPKHHSCPQCQQELVDHLYKWVPKFGFYLG